MLDFALGMGFAKKNLLSDAIILALFANGEQGAYYDPYDLTDEKLAWVAANPSFTSAEFMEAFPNHTLFQDAAGTIPVTGHSQPVGLVLDKSGRNNHASQSLSAARPLWQNNGGLKSFWFDGIDDSLITINPMDLSGVKDISSWLAERYGNIGTASVPVEFLNTGSNGSFGFISWNNNRANLGTSRETTFLGRTGTTPLVREMQVSGSISRIDSKYAGIINEVSQTLSVSNTDALGTGNFGSRALHIGSRGGTLWFFVGHIYGLIIRNTLTPENQAEPIRQLLADRSGVTL